MTFIRNILLGSVAFVMLGCATTKLTVVEPYTKNGEETFAFKLIDDNGVVNQNGIDAFTVRMEKMLSKKNMFKSESNNVIEIVFKEYYMRNGAAKFFVGSMAGHDKINTTVRIKDKSTDKILGSMEVYTKNPTGASAGVIIDKHLAKILDYVKTGAK